MRAAIYARFSSKLQNERSIADQVDVCRDLIARHGGDEVAVFEDRAISGGSIAHRPGLLSLLERATEGSFDTVVCEALDRMSRDQEDIAGIFKRLRFQGVKIITLSEGEVESLHIGLKGTMNAMYVEELAHKTRRGQAGRVKQGRIPGGLSYGYRVVAGTDDRGQRVIDQDQAEIVLRIFREYAEGQSAIEIATRLNSEHVPGPRGGEWSASTINGSRTRQNGILGNRLYIGELVYNRQRFEKHPETRRRQAKPNPESEWLRQDVPELRIVPQELWDAAQAKRVAFSGYTLNRTHRPRHALSGLLECGCCGGSYISYGAGRFGCATRRNKGTCDNKRTISAKKLQKAIFDGIREQLLAPDVVKAAVEEYRKTMAAKIAADRRIRSDFARRLADVIAREKRIVTLLEEGAGEAKPLMARLAELTQERQELETKLGVIDAGEPVVELHPQAATRYRDVVKDLGEALKGTSDASRKAVAAFRALVTKIVIIPGKPRQPVTLEIYGDLAALLSPDGKPRAECMPSVVAGVGFEPTTFRL